MENKENTGNEKSAKSNKLFEYYDVCVGDINPANVFFSSVNLAKSKGILDIADLNYVDAQINVLLSDALTSSRKSYVRQKTAKELLEGVFRVADSVYSPTPSGFAEIAEDIKSRKLDEKFKAAMIKNAAFLNNVRRRMYHIEHVARKYPGMCMDFVSDVKAELEYTDIYRAGSAEQTETLRVAGLCAPVPLSEISRAYDEICALTDIMCRISPKYLERAAMRENMVAGEIRYTRKFIFSVAVSSLYAAFYRRDSAFIPISGLIDAEDDIFELTDEELCSCCKDYIDIFINRHGIDANEYSNAKSELERLYAFTIVNDDDSDVSGDGLSKTFVARAAVKFIRENCRKKSDVAKVLFFA